MEGSTTQKTDTSDSPYSYPEDEGAMMNGDGATPVTKTPLPTDVPLQVPVPMSIPVPSSSPSNFHAQSNSHSPSTSPVLPPSEPPTPTTGHVSVPISVVPASSLATSASAPMHHNSAFDSMSMSSPPMNIIPLQQTTIHNKPSGFSGVGGSISSSNDKLDIQNASIGINMNNVNMTMDSIDVDVDAGVNDSVNDSLPPSFLPYRSIPKSNHYNYHNNPSQFSITSSTRSVKSVGSSIIDTDYDNQSTRSARSTMLPIPLAISGPGPDKPLSVSRNISTVTNDMLSVDVDEDEDVDVGEDDDDDDALSHGTNSDEENGAVSETMNTTTREASGTNGSILNANNATGNSVDIQMKFLQQFRQETLQAIRTLSTQQKRSTNILTSKLQNETNRRTALEGRLHAQLLLQAETMVAMEVKLLRLEAKVEKSSRDREKNSSQQHNQNQPQLHNNHWNEERRRRQQHNQHSSLPHQQLYLDHHHHQRHGSVVGSIGANETIDEEEDSDSFGMESQPASAVDVSRGRPHTRDTNNSLSHHGDGIVDREIEVKRRVITRSTTPPGGNRHRRHHQMHHTNPTNIAVISSGASLASGVTATSFLEETQGVEDQVRVVTTTSVSHQTTSASRSDDDEQLDDNDTAATRGDGSDGDVEDEVRSHGRGRSRSRNHGEDMMDGDGSTTSTPTQGGSRSHFRYPDIQPVANLESILLNPIPTSNDDNSLGLGISTRAVRGHDYDGNSSLATSVTNTTIASTIVTATTRGNDSINIRSIGISGGGGSSGGRDRDGQSVTMEDPAGSVSMSMGRSINEEEEDDEEGVEVDLATGTPTGRVGGVHVGVGVGVTVDATALQINNSTEDSQYILSLEDQSQGPTGVNVDEDHDRVPARNESPLTVQSGSLSVGQSIASTSVGTGSILSTAAVAPARSFRARREAAARLSGLQGPSHSINIGLDGHRQWANRVVSFTSDQVFSVPPEISEGGDSITMPDELDNLSDVADEFATRARSWRDEYEARLDAIQKRWGGE